MKERIKKLRSELRISQETIARLVNVSTPSIRNYERGFLVPPDVIERMGTLAMERGRPDLARDLAPGGAATSEDRKPVSSGRKGLGEELHRLLDRIVGGSDAEAIGLVAATLRYCTRGSPLGYQKRPKQD